MVELSGVNIKHKSFGVGKVIEQTDTYLKIEFSVGIKQFQFPEAFEKFLQCEDSNTQNIVLEALEVKKEKEAELKKQKQEEQARFIKTQTIVKPSEQGRKHIRKKILRSNVTTATVVLLKTESDIYVLVLMK